MSPASYTCTKCDVTVVGLRKYRLHMSAHRNQGEPSSSKPLVSGNNTSIHSRQASVAASDNTSRAQESLVGNNSLPPPTDEPRPKRHSKRTKRSESPSERKENNGKKAKTYSTKKPDDYRDKVKLFSAYDPLARQLDVTTFRSFLYKSNQKISYRPLTLSAKEELRRLLHSVYKSVTENNTTSSDETVKTVIRRMDKKIKQTLVPTTMTAGCFDLEKTRTKSKRIKTDILACLREKIKLDLEIYYTKVKTAKLEMEYDALDDPELESDPLAVVPVHLRKYVATKSQDLVYDYGYYTNKYPSSSFS